MSAKGERALADGPIAPEERPGFDVERAEDGPGEAVEDPFVKHRGGVVDPHVPGEVLLLGGHAPGAVGAEFQERAAGAVVRREEDLRCAPAVRHQDRSGDVRGPVRGSAVAPQQRAVVGAEARGAFAAEVDDVGRTGEIHRQRRGIAGLVALRAPDQVSGLAVEGGEPDPPAPGRDEYPVIQDQRRFADPPTDVSPPEAFEQVDGPENLTARGVERGELPLGAEGVHLAIDHCRHAAGTVAPAVPVGIGVRRRPELRAGFRIESDHPLTARQHAEGVDAAVRDRDRGVPGAESAGPEGEARPPFRPGLEQPGLPGDSVPVRPAPLRPVFAGRRASWENQEGGGERQQPHSGASSAASHSRATGNAAARSASRWSWSRRPASPASRSPGATLSGPGTSAMKA